MAESWAAKMGVLRVGLRAGWTVGPVQKAADYLVLNWVGWMIG